MHVQNINFLPSRKDEAVTQAQIRKTKQSSISVLAVHCQHLVAFSISDPRNYLFRSKENTIELILLSNPGITSLRLNRIQISKEAAQIISHLHLKHLQMTRSFVGRHLREILRLSLGPHLERLDLSYLHNEVLDPLYFSAFNHLRTLQLMHCIFVSDLHVNRIALDCPLIIHLNLYACHDISDVSVYDIAVHLTHLRSIDLRSCLNLTDRSLQHLTQYRADQLRVLYIDVCRFSFREVRDLFRRSCHLREVGVFYYIEHSFAPEEWIELIKLQAAMHKLVFVVDPLNDALVDALVQFCPQLQELHIKDCFHYEPTCNLSMMFKLVGCPKLTLLMLSLHLFNAYASKVSSVHPTGDLKIVKSCEFSPFETPNQPF
jgi:hypothetical protein